MKKNFLILLLFILKFANSQNGYVEYGYVKSLGLGNAQGNDYNAHLYFNNENSTYLTCKESLESQEKINGTKIVKDANDEVVAVINGMSVSEKGSFVFTNNKTKITLSNLYHNKNHLYVKDSAILLDWKIEKEVKKIGSFNCKKATTSFRGRNYTAWFTLEIPLPFGPWKLNGLPGLILEAYDTDKFVYWYFKNIEYPTKKEMINETLTTPENFVTYGEQLIFQNNAIKKIEDKNAVLMRDMPGIQITTPRVNEVFIEFE